MVLRRARRGIAETRVLARDEWQESATIPAPGSYKDAHRRSYHWHRHRSMYSITTGPGAQPARAPARATAYARGVTACRCPAA